jgi:Transcriptional regulator, AbiEi antitoxin
VVEAVVLGPDSGAKRRWSGPDGAVAEVAERQHGLVSRVQLLELGLGRRAIGHRLERGRLHPVHRGVYAVGRPGLSGAAWWMAAVLAAGPDAVLSHRDAAALLGMLSSARSRIEVTTPGGRRRRHGIQFHRAVLHPDEVTVVNGIPVTTVPRTLLDLAAVVERRQFERALHEAEVLRLTDALSLDDLLARHSRRPGTRAVRAVLAEVRLGAAITRNDLEDGFLRFLEEARLPRSEVNVPIEVAGRWFEADFVWRLPRLIRRGRRVGHARDKDRLRA